MIAKEMNQRGYPKIMQRTTSMILLDQENKQKCIC